MDKGMHLITTNKDILKENLQLNHANKSIRSADLQECMALAGLRLLAELKAAESNSDSALQFAAR